MSTRTDRAILRGAVRPRPRPPSFPGASFSLPAPEGRPGVLRQGTQGIEAMNPRSARTRAQNQEKDFPMTTPAQSDKDRVVIFDTTLRDGEQSPGASMTLEEKLQVAEAARRDGRRHHRGRLPDRLQGRFRGGQRDRQAHQARRRLRARARRAQGHRPRRRGDPAGAARAHPHLHLHLAGPHQVQAADGAGRRSTRW